MLLDLLESSKAIGLCPMGILGIFNAESFNGKNATNAKAHRNYSNSKT